MPDRSAPDWHNDSFPELRSGPPWVMEEMIFAEPDLPGAILRETEAAAAIASAVQRAAEQGEPIVVTGCGTSEHGAMAIAHLLNAALSGYGDRRYDRVAVRQALDVAVAPWKGGVCLAVSHEAETRATCLALETARRFGATTALITAKPDGPCVAQADLLLVTPQVDKSWCHTVAYVSAILAGAAVARSLALVRVRADPSDAAMSSRDVLRTQIIEKQYDPALMERYLREALEQRPAAISIAGSLARAKRIVTCGLGADEITARELALKIEEGARLPAVSRQLETLLHGHLAGCDEETGLVLIVTQTAPQRVTHRAVMAARAARAIGMPVAGILVSPLDRSLTDLTPAGRIILPPTETEHLAGDLAQLLGGAIALQLLTLELAHARGVNPDLIRREEEPYRNAAAVNEGVEW